MKRWPFVLLGCAVVFGGWGVLAEWRASGASDHQATATQVAVVSSEMSSLPPKLLPTLPPDPGAAGRATVEGIDADGDGVRDDVQIWIETSYPKSQRMRMALRQVAVSIQEYIEGSADFDRTFQNDVVMSRAIKCLFYVAPTVGDADDAFEDLHAIVLNTLMRSKAVLAADRHLSGMILRGYQGPKNESCLFDPQSLPD